MAGAGYKLFNTGDVLTAAQVNTYLQEQTVMVFASSTARTTALSGVLAEGMMSYLQDTNAVEVYNGSSWVNVGNAGDITEVQAGTGISVASGTGPIPVVTNTVATAFDAAGDLVYGTGADTFTKLSLGTAGKVLTVNSGATAPEWATPSGGDWVKLGSSGASGGTELVNTANFSSTYRFYYLAINRLSFTGGNLLFQFYTGGSPVTSAYYGNSFGYTAAGALVTNNNNNSGSFTLATTSASGERSAGYMYICRRADSGTPFNSFYGQLITESSAGAIRALSLSGIQDSNTNYDGIRFSPSAGTFIMEFTIYGLKA